MCVILFTSCNETVDHEFSHDENINTWVKDNIELISKYKRKDLLAFKREKQRAILRAMSPKQRKVIWEEKVDYILNMNLSKQEMDYLKWFAEAFKKIDYKSTISDEFSEELDQKVTFAAKKFNWNKNFVNSTFFSIGNVSEKDLVTDDSNIQSRQQEPDTCSCRSSFWGCSGLSNDCVKPDECKTDNGDCGVFGSSNCTGYCSAEIPSEVPKN
ncbi:hypothetical protein BTO18_15525 [Polaribacter porphyrae]|uniref:Bacteriocin fulvocin C-related protein n=2 Tax=Polaribacter porphyrae TaxID=1137780 RepID=A0A2S7WSR0_9FLAO|nr:hypothetical protein BTO18_15525 [Polaribacter porphyrae]